MKTLKTLAAGLCLLLAAAAVKTDAAEPVSLYAMADVSAGQAVVTVGLDGYADSNDPILGVQVDVTNKEPDVLTITGASSLVEEDGSALANEAAVDQEDNCARLLYVQTDETLPQTQRELMQISFSISEQVTQAGSVTLPVTARLQMKSGLRTTLTTQCTIRYQAQTEGYVSVTIEWGALDYTYSDGTWNPATLTYEGGGWTDGGTGTITVTNQGTLPTTAEFCYTAERTEISGSFTDGETPLSGPVPLALEQSTKAFLLLDGKPSKQLTKQTLGTVTVRIGEE